MSKLKLEKFSYRMKIVYLSMKQQHDRRFSLQPATKFHVLLKKIFVYKPLIRMKCTSMLGMFYIADSKLM